MIEINSNKYEKIFTKVLNNKCGNEDNINSLIIKNLLNAILKSNYNRLLHYKLKNEKETSQKLKYKITKVCKKSTKSLNMIKTDIPMPIISVDKIDIQSNKLENISHTQINETNLNLYMQTKVSSKENKINITSPDKTNLIFKNYLQSKKTPVHSKHSSSQLSLRPSSTVKTTTSIKQIQIKDSKENTFIGLKEDKCRMLFFSPTNKIQKDNVKLIKNLSRNEKPKKIK